MDNKKIYNLAILQRVIPSYRQFLFEGLSNISTFNLKVFYGDDIPNTKVKSSLSKENIFWVVKLKTTIINIFKRHLIIHHNLFPSLFKFQPNVILTEGESNIASYIQALIYKFLFRKTKIIHWSLGGLPNNKKSIFVFRKIKSFFLRFFDSYIVYSSFGKNQLVNNYKINPNKIFVALNISNIDKIISYKETLKKNKINDLKTFDKSKFTLITSGYLEENKNFQILLYAYKKLENENFNLIFLGEGKYKKNLVKIAKINNLKNIYFPGHVSWEKMVEYYYHADLFILPGRGGMVISEAMACGLPVLLKDADGTEFDLVRENKTGFYFNEDNSHELANKIIEISKDKDMLDKISYNASKLIRDNYSNKKYISTIEKAIIKTLNSVKI